MADNDTPKCYRIDRDKLPADFPTHAQQPAFWEELGRTVATFGFIEEMLGKAIYALTGTKKFDPEGDPEAFEKWIKTLERALTGQLSALIGDYEIALKGNERTASVDHCSLIVELQKAKDIRNTVCHCSWGKPDEEGRTTPTFVNRHLEVFQTPVDVQFFQRVRTELRLLACDVMDSVTSVGYKFPGSNSPGEQLWPNPKDVST